jgi:hypothetical protein
MAYSLFDFEHGTPKPKVVPKKKQIKASVPVVPVTVAGVSKLEPVHGAAYFLGYLLADNQFFRLEPNCGWPLGMTEAEVRAYWEKGEFPYDNYGYLARFHRCGGSFEALWQGILQFRVKHWLYWFATFLKDYMWNYEKLVSHLNFRWCSSACKTCTELCVAHPQHGSFGSFPQDNEHFQWWIDSSAKSVDDYCRLVDLYGNALAAVGVDLSAVDLEEALTGKKKRVKAKKKEDSK